MRKRKNVREREMRKRERERDTCIIEENARECEFSIM